MQSNPIDCMRKDKTELLSCCFDRSYDGERDNNISARDQRPSFDCLLSARIARVSARLDDSNPAFIGDSFATIPYTRQRLLIKVPAVYYLCPIGQRLCGRISHGFFFRQYVFTLFYHNQ